MKKKISKKTKTTIYFILAGVLLNGFIQQKMKGKLDSGILKEAQKEIEKLINKEL